MSPLNVERLVPGFGWRSFGQVRAGDRPGSISDNKTDGSRDIYLFECASNNSKSTVYKSAGGVDIGHSPVIRDVVPLRGLEVIKELKQGESYEITVRPDNSTEPVKYRLTHT